MKRLIISTLVTCSLVVPALAASFDTQGFGAKLNGWRQNGTAVYSFANTSYVTHKPTVTSAPSGSMFISTRVDLLAHADKGAVCQLGLTFTRAGVLESIQIKGRVHGSPIDTAVVRRGDHIPVPEKTEGEEGKPNPAKLRKKANPTDEMLIEVFRRFDLEMKKRAKSQPPVRKDLFSRLSKQQVETADLSGSLRHNINLMLQHVRAR